MSEQKDKMKKENTYYYNDEAFGSIRAPYKNELVRLRKEINVNIYVPNNLTYVKMLISKIEATVNYLKFFLLSKYDLGEINLENEEWYILNSKQLSIDAKGTIKENDKFYPFLNSFRFTYKLFSTKYNRLSIYNHNISINGYKELIKTLEVRNRVTHPKNANDPYVEGHEVKSALESYKWHEDFQFELFKDILYKKDEASS